MLINNKSYFKFPGGEVHCKVNNVSSKEFKYVVITDYSMDGFMALAQHVEILKKNNLNITVTYPYFPYARQDRGMAQDEPFSLKIFCNLINSLELYEVRVYDPHSDVTPALLKNCRIIQQHEIAERMLPKFWFKNSTFTFVSPDAGAYKKLQKLVADDRRIAIGFKHRNVETGAITNTGVLSPQPIEGQRCVIVDDICDGGRTFIALAKELYKQGAAEVYLYVTHGIFSQGLQPLKDAGIAHIYTTNSFPQEKNNLLTVKDIYETH